MPRPYSMYDSYRLSNSQAIPMYQGSTAPEALQVGQFLQGLYDTAQQGGTAIGDAATNVMGLPGTPDEQLADDLRNHVNGKLDEYSKKGDWENHVEDVRSLGRYYSQRAQELQAPIASFQKYRDETLTDKTLGLTPEQQQILLARSLKGYQGLQKDNLGRYVGTFRGVEPAKNIQISDYVDKVMKDFKPFENASSIEYQGQPGSANEGYLVKRGGSTEFVSAARVQGALQNAMNTDTDFQAFRNMNQENAQFLGSHFSADMVPDQVGGKPNAAKQQALDYAKQYGIPFQRAYSAVMADASDRSLVNNMGEYARTKYAYSKTKSEQGLSADSTWGILHKEQNANGIFGDLVTDSSVDLNAKYGNPDKMEEIATTAGQQLENATDEVNAVKQAVATKLGVDMKSLSDSQINTYLAKNDPSGLGRYKSNLQLMESSQATINEIGSIKDRSRDLMVKNKMPDKIGGYEALKEQATSKLQDALKGGEVTLYTTKNGKMDKELVNASNVGKYEVVDGDAKSFGRSGYLVVRNKETGVETPVDFMAKSTFMGPDRAEAVKKIGDMFDGLDWKGSFKKAAGSIRSNLVWMPLDNKTTTDGQIAKSGAYANRVSGALRLASSALSLKSSDMGSLSDEDKYRTAIAAGKFDVLGVGTTGSDGKLYAKLSVEVDKDAPKTEDRYKTIIVGADSNLANKLGDDAIQVGIRDHNTKDFEFGHGLKAGSGYGQVLDMGTTGRINLADKDGTPQYEVATNITGDAANALTYEVYKLDKDGKRTGENPHTFTSAMSLGTWLDESKKDGAKITKNFGK